MITGAICVHLVDNMSFITGFKDLLAGNGNT